MKQLDARPAEIFTSGVRMSDFVTPTACSLVTLSGRRRRQAGMQPNFENDTSSGFPRNPDEAARSRVPPAVVFRNRRKLQSIMYLDAKSEIAPNLT